MSFCGRVLGKWYKVGEGGRSIVPPATCTEWTFHMWPLSSSIVYGPSSTRKSNQLKKPVNFWAHLINWGQLILKQEPQNEKTWLAAWFSLKVSHVARCPTSSLLLIKSITMISEERILSASPHRSNIIGTLKVKTKRLRTTRAGSRFWRITIGPENSETSTTFGWKST